MILFLISAKWGSFQIMYGITMQMYDIGIRYGAIS